MKRGLAALVMALFIAACAKAEASSLSFSWWGDAQINAATQATLEGYQKEKKDISVFASPTESLEGYVEWMAQATADGQLADVVQLNPELLRRTARDESGAFRYADLEPYLSTLDLTQFSFLGLASGTIDGRLCAVPASMTSHVLVWNESAFFRLNLTVPQSTEELMAVGKKLEGTNVYPLAADATGRVALVITYLQSRYGRSWVDNDTRTCGFTTQQVTEGLRYLQRLEDSHVLPPLSQQGDVHAGWQVGAFWGVWTWDNEALTLSTLPAGDKRVYTARLTDWAPYDGGFQKAQYLFALSESSAQQQDGAALLEYMLNTSKGIRLMGDARGAPTSEAGFQTLTKTNGIHQALADASSVALSWARWIMPLGFEAPQLAGEDGIYQQVLIGMEEGLLTPEAAASAIMSGVKVVLME